MGSKIIGLIGVLASTAFVYYCIDLKKQEIADACHVFDKKTETQTVAPKEEASPIKEQVNVAIPEENKSQKNETEVVAEEIPVVKKAEKSDPAFGVMFGDQINIVGMFAPESKNKVLIHYIEDLCTDRTCNNDIRFSDDIKEVSWLKDMVSLMQMFNEEHIEKGSLYINSNVLHIEGEIESEEQKKRLEKLISKLKADGVFVEDEMINMMTKVEGITPETDSVKSSAKDVEKNVSENHAVEEKEEATEHVTETTPKAAVSTQTTEHKEEVVATPIQASETKSAPIPVNTISQPQPHETEVKPKNSEDDLGKILENNPIRFDTKVKVVDEKSRQTLDKIAEILKNSDVKKIEILGYASDGDSAILNMVVSQKKADIVKNYLYQKGLRHLVSKGMGAQKKSTEIEINVKKQ